jgi:hypothetical protein
MYAKQRALSYDAGRVTLWLLLFCLFATQGRAQSEFAVLSGSVLDPSARPVQNVRVYLIQEASKSKHVAWTDDQGAFVFTRLEPGAYTLQTGQTGFSLVQIPAIQLQPGEMRNVQIHFQIGKAQETAHVHSGDFEEASGIATHVSQELLEDIPLNGRTLQPLLLLTPGVIMMANNEFSFNGQATNMNYFTVDGVSVNLAVSGGGLSTDLAQDAGYSALGTTTNLISVSALDELTVQSSTISPQIGRQSGGHVQMSSRAGGEQLHGEAFEFFRNSELDASDWFLKTDNAVNTSLRQNDFGGILSGPVPPVATWTKLNTFFFSEDSLRLFQPDVLKTVVPSASLRQSAPVQLQPFLNVFPNSTSPEIVGTGTSVYHVAISNPSSEDVFSFRYDSDASRKLSFFSRYNHAGSSRVSTDSGWCFTSAERESWSSTTAATWKLSAKMANDLRFNLSDNTGNITNSLHRIGDATIPADKVLLQGISTKVKMPSLNYYFLGINYSSKSTGQNPIRQMAITDNTALSHGNHTLGFGFDLLRLTGETVPSDFNLTVDFLSEPSIQSGQADSIAIQSQDDVRVLQKVSSVYLQDTWKMTRRFSLDYGLRWDLSPTPRANNGQALYTVTSSKNIPQMTLAPAGTALYPTIYTNLCPRIGQSWMIGSALGRETILHSGAGVFYSLGNTNSMASASTFPHVRQDTLLNHVYPSSALFPIPDSNSLAAPYAAQTFYAFADGYAAPVIYQFNTGVEQHLGGERRLSLAYIGSVARHLPVTQQLTDPNGNFIRSSAILEVRSASNSSYNALQAQYVQRLGYGVHILASYTWAHSIDNDSDDLNGFATKALISIAHERGNSAFDLHQNVGMALTYETKYPGLEGRAGTLLNRWIFGSLLTARGGMPLDPTYTRPIGSQLLTTRPDRITGVSLLLKRSEQPLGQVFNYLAFDVPPTDRQGNVGRNSLRGYPAWQADFAIHRDFSLTRLIKLEGRSEFFNAFNHPTFGDPDMNLGSYTKDSLVRNPTFGFITQMRNTQLGGLQQSYQVGGSRTIQVSLKCFF